MSDLTALLAFLSTDPVDAGCDTAMAALHVYAELSERDPAEAADHYPGIAAHLAACGPCAEDLLGLLHAIAAG